jgi:hypothetical protein
VEDERCFREKIHNWLRLLELRIAIINDGLAYQTRAGGLKDYIEGRAAGMSLVVMLVAG